MPEVVVLEVDREASNEQATGSAATQNSAITSKSPLHGDRWANHAPDASSHCAARGEMRWTQPSGSFTQTMAINTPKPATRATGARTGPTTVDHKVSRQRP
jgi:hypothetical protein